MGATIKEKPKKLSKLTRKRLIWGGTAISILCIVVLVFSVIWWFNGTLEEHPFAMAGLALFIISCIYAIIKVTIEIIKDIITNRNAP